MGTRPRYRNKKWTDEQLVAAVATSKSKADTLQFLGLDPRGGNYQTIDRAIAELKLDTSHFSVSVWNLGLKFKYRPVVRTVDMLQNGTHHHSVTIKKRLFADGLKIKMCEMCWLTEWLGVPIALELDHINGINNDNRLENLRILCPNCHATTPTYRGRNQKKAKTKLKTIEPGPTKKALPKKCVDCAGIVSKGAKTGRCESCSRRKAERIDWPCSCKLSAMVSESNFLQTGKTLGVSDNAVRKRLKYHPTCECAPMIDN